MLGDVLWGMGSLDSSIQVSQWLGLGLCHLLHMPAVWLFPTNGHSLLEERRRDLRPRKLTRKVTRSTMMPKVLEAAANEWGRETSPWSQAGSCRGSGFCVVACAGMGLWWPGGVFHAPVSNTHKLTGSLPHTQAEAYLSLLQGPCQKNSFLLSPQEVKQLS